MHALMRATPPYSHNACCRDIKPENMLLAVPLEDGEQGVGGARRWHLKVVDYGGAEFAPPGTHLHKTFGTVRVHLDALRGNSGAL